MAVTVTTAYRLPLQVTQDDSIGSSFWQFTNEIKVKDDLIAPDGHARAFSTFNTAQLDYVHLVKDDIVLTGVNKATGADVLDNEVVSFGGAADLWSTTWTPTQIKSEGFGVAVAYFASDFPDFETYYLIAKGFDFSDISDSATILGIQTSLQHIQYGIGGGGLSAIGVDYIEARITYSYDPVAITEGVGGGYVYVPDNGQPKQQKTIRFFVYDSDGNYLREWHDVTTDPSLRTEVNKALYNIDLELARNPFEKQTEIAPWVLEQGGVLTDEENGLQISLNVAASIGLGEGTDVQENNTVEIKTFYGEYEHLLCEDGTPLLTEDGQALFVENGTIDGQNIYRGFIQDWEINLGGNDSVSVYLMNDAEELNNIMLETEDAPAITNEPSGETYLAIASDGIGGEARLAQTFTMSGNKTCSRLTFFIREGWPDNNTPAELSLYAGSNPNSLGTLLTSTSATVNEYLDYTEIDFVFPAPVALTNTSTYTIVLSTPYSKTLSGSIYPLYFQRGATLSGGSAYIEYNGEPFVDAGVDLAFILWEAGLDTTVPFNSYDPSDIAKAIIDFARGQGAQINYDDDSIEMTGTEVSYTFQTNTIAEALEQVVKLCPAGWYWTYHPGTNLYSLKQVADSATRKFTNKGDIVNLKIRKSLTQLLNQVYFSGGGEPALFKKVTDVTSRNQYRKGLKKLSDSRVTNDDTAVILSQSEIDNNKEPIYIASVTVSDRHPYPIESIELGEKIGFLNYGNFIDDIELQISAITYNVDTVSLDLGVILPKVTKRIQDIKRNLDVVEQQNNPVAPDE